MSTEPPFTSALFTILGALISAFAAYFAARSTWRNLQFNEAAARFIEEFVEEVIALREGDADVYCILTREVLKQQEKATVIFEAYLSDSKRELLREAWMAYVTMVRTAAPGNCSNRRRECDAALMQIERLQSFARHR